MDEVSGWSRLHGTDVSGNGLAVGWIKLVHRIARPLRKVPPDVLSLVGLLCAGGAVALARWPLLAAVLVVLAGLFDGVDGAVALVTNKARPLGALVDAVADRLGDLAFIVVLFLLGAPAWLCAAVGALVMLHEYVRARTQGLGMRGAGVVTVAERPTRVIVTAASCVGAAVSPGSGWVGAAIWGVLALVGGAQLVRAVVAELGGQRWPTSGPAHQPGHDLR